MNEKLNTFLCSLESRKISYTLAHNRSDAIMVIVAVPGQRWEIEFMLDGSVEIEKFVSSGEIFDEKEINMLFKQFSH